MTQIRLSDNICNINVYMKGEVIMATIKDVAKLAGVSICTVSRTLAGKDRIKAETREKVLNAVEELGYKPNYSARSLKTGTTDTIGLIVPDITNPYYPKITKSIEAFAEKKGYMILLCNANEDLNKEKRLVETLISRGVDGVIVLPCSRYIDHFSKFDLAGIPYVFFNRSFPGELKCVPTDNHYGAYIMTKHLLEHGHTNITASFLSFENQIYQERYEGTLEALSEYGLKSCAENFLFNVKSIEDSFNKMCKLLQSDNRPTALFASNDMLSLGAYSAANQCGLRIPQDFSIVGYDDIAMASIMMPPLTTFRQSEDEIAKVGVGYLQFLIEGESPKRIKRLRGEIVVRSSVSQLVG